MDTYGYKDRDGSNIFELDRFLDTDEARRFAPFREASIPLENYWCLRYGGFTSRKDVSSNHF
jgi:hypothetical protein